MSRLCPPVLFLSNNVLGPALSSRYNSMPLRRSFTANVTAVILQVRYWQLFHRPHDLITDGITGDYLVFPINLLLVVEVCLHYPSHQYVYYTQKTGMFVGVNIVVISWSPTSITRCKRNA